MRQQAIGIIEVVGFTTAVTAIDAAVKSANVSLLGYETVIGVQKAISLTVKLTGEVAAINAAVAAGVAAGNKVGKVVSYHVIPRAGIGLEQLINTPETKNSIR